MIEIFTLIEDSSPNPTGSYSYTLSAVGMVWKVIRTQSTEYYEYDIDYNNEASGGTVYPIINAPYNSYTGFNFIHRRPLNLLNKFSLLWSYDLNFKSTE